MCKPFIRLFSKKNVKWEVSIKLYYLCFRLQVILILVKIKLNL